MRTLTTVAAAALLLTGCGAAEDPATVTVTETVEAPAPEPPSDPPTSSASDEDEDLERTILPLSLEMAWDGMPSEDRVAICGVWDVSPEVALSMLDVYDTVPSLDRSEVDRITTEFFDGVC